MSIVELGRFNELEICKIVDFGYYLSSDEGEILLPTNESTEELKEGQKVRVFIYKDSEDRIIATQKIPKGVLDDFVCLEVKEMNKMGAFMDWGLLKDLLVPYSEQHTRMSKGESYVVRICIDNRTNRLIGVSKLGVFLENPEVTLEPKEKVDLMVYDISDLGYSCIVNNTHSGILYHNEVFQDLNIGEKIKGYIKKVREDKKIDLSINPIGYLEAIPKFSEGIINKLKENDGFLPFNDKTDPDTIQLVFKMSKKSFKKACGLLYKKGIIEIKDDGLRLIKK